MQNKVKVLLADDHNLILKGIKDLLISDNIVVVDEAKNCHELEDSYIKYTPDLVISDIEMPDGSGIDTLLRLKKQFRDVKFLFISMHVNKFNTYKIYKAGGKGLLDKSIQKDYLLFAINSIIDGEVCFQKYDTPAKLNSLVNEIESSDIIIKERNRRLNFREEQIIQYIAQGYTSVEISDKLGKSVRTIEKYRSKLIQEYELKNGNDLIIFALKHVMIKRLD